MNNIKKIVIFKNDAVGDLIQSLEAINKLSIKYKINNLKDNLKNDPLKIPKFIYSSILPKKIRYKIGEIRRGKK